MRRPRWPGEDPGCWVLTAFFIIAFVGMILATFVF